MFAYVNDEFCRFNVRTSSIRMRYVRLLKLVSEWIGPDNRVAFYWIYAIRESGCFRKHIEENESEKT